MLSDVNSITFVWLFQYSAFLEQPDILNEVSFTRCQWAKTIISLFFSPLH
jgi:hypothetical protein